MFGREKIIHIYRAYKHRGEEGYTQYSSEVEISYEELENKLINRYKNFEFGENKVIKITEYTDSGRVKTINIGNINIAGTEIRSILGLKSTNFNIEIGDNNIKFKVIGYGHGVGMSQTGADSLANQGYNYKQIIEHYYFGTEIKKMN